jgi:hypothetical protein
MDLNQRKLNRDEWNGIEVPVNEREKMILNLIIDGFHNVNIKYNNTLSLLDYLKTQNTPITQDYTYENYLMPKLKKLKKKYSIPDYPIVKSTVKMKKADMIRMENNEKNILENLENIFEFKLIEHFTQMHSRVKKNSQKWIVNFYTLTILNTYNVKNLNEKLLNYIRNVLETISSQVTIKDIIKNGYEIIENNSDLLKYSDEELYEHQRELFTVCKRPNAKLVLYIAPTGTGKTLSPIGLSEQYKVIFVCAARHIGLALAKSAISIGKKVAFAFGCNDAEDIRLHYFAAKDYTVNRKTGGIWKVDNTVGDKVEIMISDIKSYIPAMYYMQAFNPVDKIILYWDEPTITMDYDYHDIHEIIKRNWRLNLIPNIVLSSATLPQQEEMRDTLIDYKNKFIDKNPEIHSIVSHDYKKTIPIINKDGYVEMPHYLYESYDDMKLVVRHCDKYKTLMRYMDLSEIIKFIVYVNENNLLDNESDKLEHIRNFPTIESINMKNIKLYYLKLLKRISREQWSIIYNHLKSTRVKKHISNIYVTTQDAHTLTDGPTIFLANDTTKIASFCIQMAKIPADVIREISNNIRENNIINSRITVLEKDIEDGISKEADNDKHDKKIAEGRFNPEIKRMMKKVEEMRTLVKRVTLNEMFIPNTRLHLNRFDHGDMNNAFTSNISEQVVEKIMQINGIEDTWKLLLMMGIGVFANQENAPYMEIMKKLAQEQKLYLIIASSDYIYGTNYQFCHAYISKDLNDMSQEKCIQAMGRVGRNNLQYTYSVRFRDDELIYKLFCEDRNKPEVKNMARLFITDEYNSD